MQNSFYHSEINQKEDPLPRHITTPVNVCWKNNNVVIGGEMPIRIQSMTNTDTANINATVIQIKELVQAGSELVRLTVNTRKSAAAIPIIRDKLDQMNIYTPLIGDFHYNGHLLLSEYPDCAVSLSKYRINPGNIGGHNEKFHKNFAQIIKLACKYNKPIRIGVNWGSINKTTLARIIQENTNRIVPMHSKELMYSVLIKSALESANEAQQLGMKDNQIILSCKVSAVQDLIKIYKLLASQCNYALHLGLTEAGTGIKGIVASCTALGHLLQSGIGDTIRISITPKPEQSRNYEVIIAQEILQTIGLRYFNPTVISCPGCGRTDSTLFQKLAFQIQNYLYEQTPKWHKEYYGIEQMSIAVMGCIVNGPGESKYANIGISLPGTGETLAAPVYINGKKAKILYGNHIAEEFQKIIDSYIQQNYIKK